MPIIFLDKLDSYKMFVNNVKDLKSRPGYIKS